MDTSVVEVGTPPHQLAAVFQSLPLLPPNHPPVLIVTTLAAVTEQPPEVAVTVYVVVEDGLAVKPLPVVALNPVDGAHV
jgi:hypothetical protein